MNSKYSFLLKYKPYKCEICGISTWQNKEITLEVHHINGNHNDNTIRNLGESAYLCISQRDGKLLFTR